MKKALLKISSLKTSYGILLLLALGMFFKNILLEGFFAGGNQYILSSSTGAESPFFDMVFTAATVLLLVSPAFLFKSDKGKLAYLLVFNILFTFLGLGDICYFRYYAETPSFSLIPLFFEGADGGEVNLESFIGVFSAYDLFFLADYLFIGLWAVFKAILKKSLGVPMKKNAPEKEYFLVKFLPARLSRFLLCLFCGLLTFGLFPLAYGICTDYSVGSSYKKAYDPAFNKNIVLQFTPIGYHIYDVANIIGGDVSSPSEQESDLRQIARFYQTKERLPENEFFSLYEGKNVILLQWESLETLALNATAFGKEITPNLNRLIAENSSSLCFPNLYDEVKAGNSSDCDLMVNSSILPTSDVFFKYYADRDLPSMPEILREKGYLTYHFNGSGSKCVWKYEPVYKTTWGYNTDRSDPDCNFFLWDAKKGEETIRGYLSDRLEFERVTEKLSSLPENTPFFAHVVLCSSHMPFTMIYDDAPHEDLIYIPEDEKLLENHSIAYLNALHYTDKQLGIFLDNAKKAGLLDNTVIFIFGDHTGVHKYYPSDATKTAKEFPELSYLSGKEHFTVPLVIYDPSGNTAHKEVTVNGGQVDIMPTVLSLLGVKQEEYSFAMGRNLLNTKRNYVVLPGGTLIGSLSKYDESYETAEHVYETADLIVKYDYFGTKEPEQDKQ